MMGGVFLKCIFGMQKVTNFILSKITVKLSGWKGYNEAISPVPHFKNIVTGQVFDEFQ